MKLRNHTHICTGCGRSFTTFKQLKNHWDGNCPACQCPACQTASPTRTPTGTYCNHTAPVSPNPPQMIDPAENMWLNDDYAPWNTPHEDTLCDDAPCEDVACDTEFTSSQQATSDQNELLFILLGVVEELSAIVLGDNPIHTPSTPQAPPSSPKSDPPPPTIISTPTMKTDNENEWVTIPVKRKSQCSREIITIDSPNRFDPIAPIPSSPAESVDETPANTWASSPVRNDLTQVKRQQQKSKSHQRRPSVVVSKFPERNNTWKTTVPGNSSFSEIVKHGRKVVLFSDSICNRFNERELNQKVRNCHIKKKSFPGATATDLAEHHMHPYLKKNLPDVALIHAGANDIFHLGGKQGALTEQQIDEVITNILTCGIICKEYGINKVTISSVLPGRNKDFNLSAMFINNKLEQLCEEVGFDFIRNFNIVYEKPTKDNEGLFYRDGLHLNDDGRDILMKNFLDYLDNHD